MTDLSNEALMARRRIAERLEQAPWAFEPHGDTGDYGVGILLDDNAIAVSGEQQTGERFVAEVVAVEVKGVGYATHIAANAPTTVIATIDEVLRLREQVEALTNMREIQLHELAVELINEAVSDKAGENLKVISLGATCPHCNMQFSTAVEAIEHDATCPKHPATIRAERLENEADWPAENCWKKIGCEYIPTKDERGGMWCDECPHEHDCRKCWREAARKAVEES